jgi:hypothetical protein
MGCPTVTSWPIDFDGVTESVVTTRGPADRWNAAALGLHGGRPVTARTWGETRTRKNFDARGSGYVQFVADPEVFVEAALGISEHDEPILDAAAAWVHVSVDRVAEGTEVGTAWVDWALEPEETQVTTRSIPRLRRGTSAVVEATVAASRLDVAAYDRETLSERLDFFAEVVQRCGDAAEKRAMARVWRLSSWEPETAVPLADWNESF